MKRPRVRIRSTGPKIISFPVRKKKTESGVKIPAGSYVRGRLVTGISTPEGKLIPALIALEYSFVGPNKSRIPLQGCFALAKSQGSMSLERIELMANKISCVGTNGKMFERDIKGYVVDDSDQSFALKAELKTNQGRVAGLAFMNAVVSGVSDIVKRKAQNIGGANPDTSSANLIVQQGAGDAASQVANWYMRQAENLSPILITKSGSPLWLVMNETVDLPNDYFNDYIKKGDTENESFISILGN